MSAAIEFRDVSRVYGEVRAVDRVSLTVQAGEFFAMLGPSGSGKTTCLRLVAGFETPDSGSVLLNGRDVTDDPPYARAVNTVFQDYALFPHMSVLENVAYGPRVRGQRKDDWRKRAAEMLELVQLGAFADRRPAQLSGGQRQRVALARALINQPPVLLLDEPLGALDKKLREHTQFELVNLQEQLGVTFIVVTHDQEEAMTLSSRIGVMEAGRIVQTGTPKDIYEYPNCKYVAEFIGNINVFQGTMIEDEPDHVRIASPEMEGTIYVNHGVSAASDAVVWAAVRPEKIQLSVEPPQQQDNVTRGVVKEIAYTGDMSIYLLQLSSGKMMRVTQPNAYRHADDFTWDQQVYLHWHASSPVVLIE
jgi:putrescine transport system ATP-binding protein